jgi:hypothetical protein
VSRVGYPAGGASKVRCNARKARRGEDEQVSRVGYPADGANKVPCNAPKARRGAE